MKLNLSSLPGTLKQSGTAIYSNTVTPHVLRGLRQNMNRPRNKYGVTTGDDSHTENGNVFFYILLAIVLLAALTYAVSNDRDGSTNIFTDEQAKIAAQEIIEYGSIIANAVNKLQLRGCLDTEISFENQLGNYTNASAPADKSCHVFDLAGGGALWKQSSDAWRTTPGNVWTPWFNGETSVVNVGSSESELTLYLPQLKYIICEKINESVNGVSPSPETITAQTVAFDGTYPNLADDIGDDAGNVHAGVTTACKDDGGGAGTYYQVLIAR